MRSPSCLCLSVCPSLSTFEPHGRFNDIWQGDDATQGDLYAVFVNPIPSTILKWLGFKVVSWRHDFQPCTAAVWDCLTIGLLWLHHIQCLPDVTMAIIACYLL
jgi:hypothetical protein